MQLNVDALMKVEEALNTQKEMIAMAMERVMRGADASLVVMHILTSKKMPKRVYIDDVIDRVALFLRFQVCCLLGGLRGC